MKYKQAKGLTFFLATFVWLAALAAKPVPLAETPAAVQQTITAQVGAGHLDEIDRTNEAGEITFDVSFTSKSGEDQGFTVADDGTLLSVEVGLEQTPEAVQKTIQTMAAGWQLDDINKNVADAEISYEADVSKGGRSKSFTVDADGALSDAEVTLTETPAAVQTAIAVQLAGGTVESIDEDFDPEGNSYDIEARAPGGARKAFSVAADGTLLSEEIALGRVPPAARKAIREKIGDGKIVRIDKTLGEPRGYSVQGRKEGKPFDFSVGPRGKFLGMDE